MSKFLNLNSSDFIKGLIVAVLGTVISMVYSVLQTNSLEFDWKAIGMAALTSGMAYIMKNLFTNSEGKMMKKEI